MGLSDVYVTASRPQIKDLDSLPLLQKLIGKNLNLEKFRQNFEYICEKYFHETVAFIKEWGIAVPIIAGGPRLFSYFTRTWKMNKKKLYV